MPKSILNYNQGKIYEIVCRTTGKRYIGSTGYSLEHRMNGHRTDFKHYEKTGKIKCRSSLVMESGNYVCNLLYVYPCDCRDDLELEEGRNQILTECVNKTIAGYKSGAVPRLPVPQRYLDMIKGNNLTERQQRLKSYIRGRGGIISKQELIDKEIKRLMDNLIDRVIAGEKIECKVCKSMIRRGDIITHNKTKKHRDNLCLKKIQHRTEALP